MHSPRIEFYDEYAPKYRSYTVDFRQILLKTLQTLSLSAKPYLVEVSIVSAETIQTMNHDTRGKDVVTDVLSFPFHDDTLIPYDDGKAYVHLGAIAICAPQAITQSNEYGHDEDREFKFLFVHGLLHLLGYDHKTPEEEQTMFALQNTIIGKRGANND